MCGRGIKMNQRKNKTIANCVEITLIKNNAPAIMWGDCWLLDEAANLATHTNLMTLHPMIRHHRIFSALEKSKRFKKSFVRIPGMRGYSLVRYFELIKDESKQ